MSVAIAQMKLALADPKKNKEKMLAFIAEAYRQGAESIVFPELSLSGPLYDELAFCDGLLDDCAKAAQEIAAAAIGIKVIFGNIYQENGRVFSRIYSAADGRLQSVSAAGADNYFSNCVGLVPFPGEGAPIDFVVDGHVKQALFLLGDWREKTLPATAYDANLVFCLSPQPLNFGAKQGDLPDINIPCIQVNCIGMASSGKTNYLYAGHSFFADEKGEIIAAAPYFEEGLSFWTNQGGAITAPIEPKQLLPEALIAGVRQFHAMIGMKRAVIGISGGIDSALAACVYREALGADNVFLISMPSTFNSQATKSLAAGMAEGLGLNFLTAPISDSVGQFYQTIAHNPFENNSGDKTYVELAGSVKENIMARERTRILAAIAAGLDAAFTCNGNKAELAVGYATFYGDLAGAFAAQADLWKYQVYAAASRFQEIFPEAPLDQIAAIRPSAELSAAHDVTKGLGDPLIYVYHDYLLRSWVEKGQCPTDTLKAYADGCLEEEIGCEEGLIASLFGDSQTFITDTEKWWRMYRGIGVAKRLQAPPLLALSSRPFGEPKPQLQGAIFFDREFEELKRKLIKR